MQVGIVKASLLPCDREVRITAQAGEKLEERKRERVRGRGRRERDSKEEGIETEWVGGLLARRAKRAEKLVTDPAHSVRDVEQSIG